jgi:hypothetical protein
MKTHKYILTAVLVLALVTVACGINLPVTNIQTGPTQTVDIQIPMPKESSSGVDLNLEFVAGELNLAPGASQYLASGTATFNVPEFEPKLESSGFSYTLRPSDPDIEGIPNFKGDLINTLDIKLADTPMNLNIKAGAYTGTYELGGLSLKKLAISEGGSDVTLAFSSPNQVEMSSFTYSTGGSKMVLKGLANAHFAQMTLSSGAGDYTLDFAGELQRDASVKIDSGAATVNIIVPQGMDVRLTFDGALTDVNVAGAWKKNGSAYSIPGSGPTLTLTVTMAAGTLNLGTE